MLYRRKLDFSALLLAAGCLFGAGCAAAARPNYAALEMKATPAAPRSPFSVAAADSALAAAETCQDECCKAAARPKAVSDGSFRGEVRPAAETRFDARVDDPAGSSEI
jgi:hypothetical protein